MDLDTGREADGVTLETSGGGLSLCSEAGFPPGSLLKIELPEALLLGEVCYRRSSEKGWVMGIKIAHTLRGLNQYQHLREAMTA